MKIASQIISWVFLPLFMPIYGLLITLYVQSMEASIFQEENMYWLPPQAKWIILALYFIFVVVVPGVSLLIMRRKKQITTIEMDDKNERFVPMVITAIYCAFLGIFLQIKAPNNVFPSAIYSLPWGGFIAILLAGLINRKEKISLHAMGGGMLFGYLVAYYMKQQEFFLLPIVASALIAGIIMAARMYLGKHTLFQSISGFFLGFFCVFLMVTFYPFGKF